MFLFAMTIFIYFVPYDYELMGSYVQRDKSGKVLSASKDLKNYVGKTISKEKALLITSPGSGYKSASGGGDSFAAKELEAYTRSGTGVPVILRPGESYESAVARSAEETAKLTKKARGSRSAGAVVS